MKIAALLLNFQKKGPGEAFYYVQQRNYSFGSMVSLSIRSSSPSSPPLPTILWSLFCPRYGNCGNSLLLGHLLSAVMLICHCPDSLSIAQKTS